MPKRRIATELNSGTWFLTMTTVRWYYLFDRHNRWQLLADSLQYCQDHKGLEINGYVFMLNHIHLIVTAPDVAGFTRDFKRFTSRQLHRNLQANEANVLELFTTAHDGYQFWQPGCAPKRVESADFYTQKLGYIHNNPVRKGYVMQPEYWKWSSANPHSPLSVKILA